MTQIPEGWIATNLGELVFLKTGPFGSTLHKSDYVENGVPVVNPMHINDGKIIERLSMCVSRETADRLTDFRLKLGDIVLGRRGEMGRCAVITQREVGWLCGTGSLIVRPIAEVIDSKFLSALLGSQQVVDYLLAASVGSTMANLNQEHLLSLKLGLPPRSQQTLIVEKLEELLSDLDTGVAELKAAHKKLGHYRQSLLKAAVEGACTAEWRKRNEPQETGAQLLQRILKERRARWEAKQITKFSEQGKSPPKEWQKKYPEPVQPDISALSELPQSWVWASVDQLSEFVRNGISKTPNTDGRGFPLFKINAVRPMAVSFAAIKHIELEDREASDYWVEIGDVLATRYNGSVDLLGVFGMVKALPQPTLHPDKLIRMKPLLGIQLGAWMEVCGNTGLSRAHLVSRVKTTAGQTGISGEDLKRTPIPLPPLAEQHAVLACLDECLLLAIELGVQTEFALKQSAAQRKNILKAAFSGQLVPQDPSDEPASVLLARIRVERAERHAAPHGRKARKAA